MKRFFSFFVVIFFVLSLFAVSADEISFSDAKMNFSKVYSENYVEGYSEIRNGIVRADFVTELLAKAYASVTDLEEAEVILKELKIYKMDTSEYFEGIPWSELKNLPVYMNEPDVFYDSVTDEWLIVGSGYWQNDEEWKKDESFNLFSNVQNIGYNDVVGFLLYDSENGKHYSVRDTLTCITNGENAKYYENINNHSDDSSVYIEFCDYIDSGKYMGKYFSLVQRYSKEFASSNAIPAFYYVHTCKDGTVKFDFENGRYSVDKGFIIDTVKGITQIGGEIHLENVEAVNFADNDDIIFHIFIPYGYIILFIGVIVAIVIIVRKIKKK